MSTDDGHGPKHGCGWQKCGNPSAEVPCPFIKDEVIAPVDEDDPPVNALCKHEWRQVAAVWVTGDFLAFYCIHCTTTKKVSHTMNKPTLHNKQNNRGRSFTD